MSDVRKSNAEADLRELVIAVAYAEHWLRDTAVFAKACHTVGLRYRPGKGLYETVECKIPNPYDGP